MLILCMRKEKWPKKAVNLSNCRNFPLLQEISVAEYNSIVRIVAGSSETGNSMHAV